MRVCTGCGVEGAGDLYPRVGESAVGPAAGCDAATIFVRAVRPCTYLDTHMVWTKRESLLEGED